jgi:transcription elongation factor Elf1
MTRIRRRELTEWQMVDAEIASRMKCPECGKAMEYEGWLEGHRYVATATCRCGKVVEF